MSTETVSCCARCGRARGWHLGLGGMGICDQRDLEAKLPETALVGGYLNASALAVRPHVWGHSKYEDGDEGWHGADTREEAIAFGMETYEGEPFWIQEGEPFDPYNLVPDASDLMERIVDATCDADPGPPDGIDDPVFFKEHAESALDDMLAVWARQYVECAWWKPIGKPEKITPTTGTYAEAES
jgi:hypothetical protein